MKTRNSLPLGVLAGSLLLSGSAFAITELESGYMQDAQQAQQTQHQQGEGKCGVAQMDSDNDGKVSRQEFAAAHDGKDERFAAHDLDSDGFITQAEMEQHHAQKREAAAQGGEQKQAGEGKCGEGKCGGGKCGGNR